MQGPSKRGALCDFIVCLPWSRLLPGYPWEPPGRLLQMPMPRPHLKPIKTRPYGGENHTLECFLKLPIDSKVQPWVWEPLLFVTESDNASFKLFSLKKIHLEKTYCPTNGQQPDLHTTEAHFDLFIPIHWLKLLVQKRIIQIPSYNKYMYFYTDQK